MTEKVGEGPRHEPGVHFSVLSRLHPEGPLTRPSFPQETGGGKKEHGGREGGRRELETRPVVTVPTPPQQGPRVIS